MAVMSKQGQSFLRSCQRASVISVYFSHQVAKATGVADEAIGNVRTVRAFAMEPKEME